MVDFQNDFCDPRGALFVPGADQDCVRVAEFLRVHAAHVDALYVSCDRHPRMHVAHPCFWRSLTGDALGPFDTVSFERLRSGACVPVRVGYVQTVAGYLAFRAYTGKGPLYLWPEHCVRGSWGQAVHPLIVEAVRFWQRAHRTRHPQFFFKGENPCVEQFSVLSSEYLASQGTADSLFVKRCQMLRAHERIFVAGEALSHCVVCTLQDMQRAGVLSRVSLLKDGSSVVPGFEQKTAASVQTLCAQGLTWLRMTEAAELLRTRFIFSGTEHQDS